jgi:hypothetical protein
MATYPLPRRLTALQRELIDRFFALEQRFFLTGGAALAGFYLGHRETEDLDLFSPPGPDLEEAAQVVESVALACGGHASRLSNLPTFRRLLVRRGEEQCLVDLIIDSAPMIDAVKRTFGAIRVDTLREIAANKLCALVSRSEIKDLVDLALLVASGVELERAIADASVKDAGAEPATVAWVVDQMSIGEDALMPGGVASAQVDSFRADLVRRLRAMSFEQTRQRE